MRQQMTLDPMSRVNKLDWLFSLLKNWLVQNAQHLALNSKRKSGARTNGDMVFNRSASQKKTVDCRLRHRNYIILEKKKNNRDSHNFKIRAKRAHVRSLYAAMFTLSLLH